jgi:KDO2-lipid IV(A) lauroyltransferase
LNRKRKVLDICALDIPVELPLFTRNLTKISFRVHTSLSHRLQYSLLVLFSLVLRALPRKFRSFLGAALGQCIHFLGIRRHVTEANLASAFPTLPKRGIRTMSSRVYRHFGRVAVSFVSIPGLLKADVGKWIYVEGFDVLTKTLEGGKGGLFVSGHLGNWEIMGGIVARCGFPVTFVVTTQSNKMVEELIDRYRIKAGVEIIKRRDAVRGVLSALKRNRLVAILIDQDAHEDGAFVPFFGKLASTPRGPAVFHLRTGSPLIFAHSIRLPGDRYRIRLTPVNTHGLDDADTVTAHLTTMLEQAVRETPEQWLWMHRRWKTRKAS